MPASEFDIQPAGYKALDALRIEKGYLYWSGDITPGIIPLEAGLGMFVGLEKHDFIGKEALEKIQKQGLSSRLVALTMDAGGNLYGGESVYANGRSSTAYARAIMGILSARILVWSTCL